MNTIRAYLAFRDDGQHLGYVTGRVFLSKGQAVDFILRGHYKEIVLHYEGDLNKLVEDNNLVWYVTDTISDPDIMEVVSRNFYFSREEAIEAAKKAGLDAGVWNSYSVFIDSPGDYVPVQLPVQTTLLRNEKGLYCRLNLHPEEEGLHAKGKIFFPDRACAEHLCEGPVMIHSVKDKGNYGFFSGEMVQFKAPSDAQVSEYIIKNSLYESKVRFMEGKFGTYANIYNSSNTLFSCRDYLVLRPDGCVEKNYDMAEYGEVASKCTEEILGVDLVCQGYQGCNFEDFYNRFVRFGFDAYGAIWSTRFISKLFDEAIKCGFIAIKSTNHVDFVEVSKARLMEALDQFSQEEMAEIIAKVNEINNKANEDIQNKIRSGKLRLY